ncbi:MAG: phosphatase PAP2 family protein [Dechloromonas sp.]|nr:phosphatase PAP2 family protein [Dechloromonas sp.]
MHSRVTEYRWVVGSALVLAIVLTQWPAIDLHVAALFAQNDWQWLVDRDQALIRWPYHTLPYLGRGLIIGLLLLWAGSFLHNGPWLRRRRMLFGFMLSAALLGPVLIVDSGLKNHLGRARPAQVSVLGGTLQFSPAFVVSDQCARNCSFVSGHVATTAFIMVFGWLGKRRTRQYWLLASIGLAAYMAFVRMSSGGHFLSDCIFAWYASYLGLWLTEQAFLKRAWLSEAKRAFMHTVNLSRPGFFVPGRVDRRPA